jgi:aryl-alcohol dehydrogenase-like predicted oxidoreductase
MRNHALGRTGLFVSELCLGTMTFGGTGEMWSQIGDVQQADAERLVGQAIDAGINFIDTADVYSGGQSEEITGQALKNLKVPRDSVVVATKVFGETGKGPNARGLTRSHILDGVKASLKRLQLDHIDLYQVHGFDPATPMDETLRALDQMVRHGHVRYIGVSNWAAWQIAKALGISERLGLARFESLQAYYTVAGRDLERELVPMLRSENVGLMVWSPLAGGLLSGKYGRDQQPEQGSRRTTFDFPPVHKERAFDVVDAMRPMAESRGVSVAQIALGWLLHQPQVTSVIVGAKRPEQLADNIAATAVKLTAAELEAIDKVSKLPAEYPGWMLERQGGVRRAQMG